MLAGFYTAASGMLVQQRTLNVVANNLANARTPGFRADRVVSTTFEHALMISRENGKKDRQIGKGAPIRIIEDVPTQFDEEAIEETERPFDMAIRGDGFFNIQGENDTQFLTRNGNFDIDAQGFLVLRGVGQVLGEKGPLQVKNSSFTVEEDASVYASDGKLLGKLLITAPQAVAAQNLPQTPTNLQNAQNAAAQGVQATQAPMVKYQNGLYTSDVPTAKTPAIGMKVFQGKLERSNLDMNREYTQMMEAQRSFQSCSAALQIIDTLNAKTATQIASLG